MSYNSKYKGAEVDAALDLAKTALQEHQDISGKQDKVLKFEDVTASNWVSDSTYEDYPYRCDISCSGVTANDYAEVVFSLSQAISGAYAPICETAANVVKVWSNVSDSIVVPIIIVTKL